MPETPAPVATRMRVSRALRIFAWLSFLAETLIIATGGAVRLTGSGLGCSEWPLCTPESLVPTKELGIHGIIEFGNRTMTGLVGGLAIIVLLLVLRAAGGRRSVRVALWYAGAGIVLAAASAVLTVQFFSSFLSDLVPPDTSATSLAAIPVAAILLISCIAATVHVLRITPVRRDLVLLAALVLIGVVAQGLVGGITVLTDLNAFIVGFHYAASLLLVCIAAAFLVRMDDEPGPRARVVPLPFAIGMHVSGLALAVTIFFGVLTTGSGPHSGDANVVRDGFDASFLAHVHSWPGYVLVALLLILATWAQVARLRPHSWLLVLMLAVAVQVFVGVWQAREGLPPLLVGIHMVLAALSAAAYTVAVLRMKEPVDS